MHGLLAGVPYHSSPNRSSRPDGWAPEVGVIHFTAGGKASGSVRWLQNPDAKASAHFVIGRNGERWQLVPLGIKAWHAGASEWVRPSTGELTRDVNRFSVGFELANWGPLFRGKGGDYYGQIGRRMFRYDGPPPFVDARGNYWEPYPQQQIDALKRTLEEMETAGWVLQGLVGHEHICAPQGRKIDPGPAFPWEQFEDRALVT